MSTNITVHGFADLVEALLNESDEALVTRLKKPGPSVLRISFTSPPEPEGSARSSETPASTADTDVTVEHPE